jgi:hypothetical protein
MFAPMIVVLYSMKGSGIYITQGVGEGSNGFCLEYANPVRFVLYFHAGSV